MKASPKWKRFKNRTLYKGRVHIVEYDIELFDGSKSKFEVDHSDKQAVAVFIKTPENKIILSHQYRFPVDEWIYDLPGGACNVGESLEQAAIRECREEVGIIPERIMKLVTFYPNPGRSDWAANIFYCDKYEKGTPVTSDTSETIKRVSMPVDKLKKMIHDNKIIDPSLLISWYTAISKGYIKV